MHERIRDNLLAAWGRSVAAHPIATLAICMPLVVASVLLTVTRLEFHADRSQLIDPDISWNKLYADYKSNFPRYDDVIVVVEGEPGDAAIDQLTRTIAQRLQGDPRIAEADAGFDTAKAGPKFFFVADREGFDKALGELAEARDIAEAPNANAALGTLLAGLGAGEGDAERLDQLDRFLAPYLAAANGGAPNFDFLLPTQSRWQPFAGANGQGRLRYVRVSLPEGHRGVNLLGPTLKWLRHQVGEIVAASPVPNAAWGVTGIPAIESDETSQAIHDSTVASVLAIVLITLVMFVAFRGLTVPLLAAISLMVGMVWSFGWLILAVGHLQLLSVVFSVILLGMGIDFALLYVSRLELVKDEHDSLASATARVYRRVGPGMVTGAVTTAAAFAATAFTNFKGMAEMGIIAAGGIVLCLIAVLSVFPALLALTGRWKQIIRRRPGGETASFARGRLDFIDGHPVAVLVAAGLIVAGLAWSATRIGYDPNVLNLQSAGVESVQWESRIVDEDARSVWSAVVLADQQDAADLVHRLQGVKGVSGVGGMGMLYPSDLDERLARVTEIRGHAPPPPVAKEGMAELLPQLALVQAGIRARIDSAPADVQPRMQATADAILRAIDRARHMSEPQRGEAWGKLNAAFTRAAGGLGQWAAEALADRAPGLADLPPVLRRMWVGADGSWLLMVYPDADPQHRSILHPDRLSEFVGNLREALFATGVPVIGAPVQIYESSELIKREYIKAAGFAIAAILVLLFLDFRRLSDALCAMAPVTVGFVGAFGIMAAIKAPLNFANIIVLPIIFGIGVNAGVHVVHRWRLEPFGKPKGLSGATGRGITLTMITTMIGFGCLMIAQHRGIRSLGFIMVIGLGVTLLACYTILPAILRLRRTAALQAAEELRREAVEERIQRSDVQPAKPRRKKRERVKSKLGA